MRDCLHERTKCYNYYRSEGDLGLLHKKLIENNVKCTFLDVPYAYHSAQVQEIAAEYEMIAANVQYSKPQLSIVSTLLARNVKEMGVFCGNYLARQAREPVDFLGAVQKLREINLPRQDFMWVEIGPRPTCISMVRSMGGVSPTRLVPSMRPGEDEWLTISMGLAEAYRSGVNVDWNNFHKGYDTNLQLLDLPTYAFDLKSYWIKYEGDWNRVKLSSSEATPAAEAPFSRTTLQKIESDVSSDGQRTVVFLSDLNNPGLNDLIKGHRVDDWALCPSSVYSDMAYSAATYMWTRTHPDREVPAINVAQMKIHAPIVLQAQTEQHMKVIATYDGTSSGVRVNFSLSPNTDSSAECLIKYEDKSHWIASWEEQAYFVRSVADRLVRQGIEDGTTERLSRKTAYRMFSHLVDYTSTYQGMDEVFLDAERLEGYAKIKLHANPAGTDFGVSPYWIDSLGHLSGFVLNASSNRTEVYISEGFDSMRLLTPLSEVKTYHSYVRMLPSGKPGWMSGNVYILDDSKIVGVFQCVKFRAMKRKALEMVMGSHSKNIGKGTEIRVALRKVAPEAARVSDVFGVSNDASPSQTPSISGRHCFARRFLCLLRNWYQQR